MKFILEEDGKTNVIFKTKTNSLPLGREMMLRKKEGNEDKDIKSLPEEPTN